jgi:hypothetical protein
MGKRVSTGLRHWKGFTHQSDLPREYHGPVAGSRTKCGNVRNWKTANEHPEYRAKTAVEEWQGENSWTKHSQRGIVGCQVDGDPEHAYLSKAQVLSGMAMCWEYSLDPSSLDVVSKESSFHALHVVLEARFGASLFASIVVAEQWRWCQNWFRLLNILDRDRTINLTSMIEI